MSWAEYKKKREEQENMEMSYSQENNDSNNETSSWQKYKQKREEQKVQQTETLPVANKANTAPKTTTNLTEADLRKIEQNSGLKTGTLNLNKMQAQQQKFENLQQKGNEILQDKNNKIYDVDYIYSDLGIDNGKVFKKSSAFKDGYDFGDITKTVLDTGATLGTEVVKGVANIGENIGDLASYGIAGVADLLGKDEYADKVRKNAQVSLVDKYTKPLSSKIDKNSILGSKGKEMAESLGYVAGTAAIGTATGGTAGILGKTAEGAAKAANIATTATTFASSMGSGITEAYQNGATDQEALAYGIISGIGEAGSELMFGGLGKVFGKVGFNPTGGALDEVVVQGLSRNIKNKMVKTLVQSGLMATGEGIEEVVSGVVSAIGKKATFMKEEDLKNILKDENLAEQFWMGTLTSVIAQAPSTISSIKNKTDYLTGGKWEITQKNETPESPQNVQNNIEQQTIQTDAKTAQNQNMSQISDTNENNLKNTAINEINNSKISEQAKKDMLNAINGMENVDEESYNNIKQTLNEINKNELQTNSTYQDNLERRKNYVKYKDDINTYDNSAVEEVLSIIPTNRNGKRTVNQWLQVADEIGKRISGKSNAEIQEIAYKSWFENQPTKNITQYDSARKTSIGFQKLNSDMWVNKINEAVLKERTRLENTTNSQQVNLNNTQTNQESLFEDILNNKELPMQSYIYEKSDNPNIDENQIKSVYGRNNLNNYINKNNFEQIYKKNEELDFNEGIQYSNVANSSIKDSITPQNENVNTTTKYSMQESENNSGSFSINSQNNKTWQDYLEKNYKTAGTRTNMQDILVSKATNNNKERVRDILSRNGSFSEQVDKYIADKLPSGDFLYLGETPTVLQNLGLPNNEVILKQSKLKTLMQESNNNTDKLHELPIETIKKIPEAIANPLNILQSSTDKNSVVIITDLADANERPIIASIEVNYDGQIGNIDFLSNRLTSAYGKNNYDRFMKTEIAKGNLLYDIDEGIIKELPATRLQSPKGISSFVDTNNNVSTINSSISQNNDSVKSNTIITNNYAQQIQNDTHKNQNVAPSVANNSLPIGEYTGKQRKHYKSIMESAETTPQAKKIAKELLNSDTYVPETNKGQLERADARIMSSTPESELNSLSAKAINGEKISSVDIAVGERLIQYYSKTGNAVKLQEAIQTTAMAGTSAGQTVQALSLLNHQTPQGQAMWLQKSVDKMNNELARRKGGKISKDENGNIRVINNKGVDITEKVELFNLTPEMIQNVVSSKNDVELSNNLNKVYEQLGQQVTRTTAQKIDAWRYFSMLANPRTHIRNITGNVAMGGVQGIKNKVAGVIEGVANKINPDMERSHTIKPASKEVKAFAKADIENVTDRLGLSENKYNPKTRLENSMRTFKSDVMENTVGKMFDLNNKALEVEDGWGLKAGYTKALSEYMTANNLTPDTITDKQLGKARNYAIQQAKEATFHQDSSIASLLNQLSNKNKFSKFILDSTLPFKKTPINVAKAGLEYSPVGLVKSAIYDTVQLRKGNITVNTYIDNISKGLTGSGIALVGYALADCGILKATGSDDEDREKFEESRGSQNYSVKIGDNTYSLDWLAPAGIPLFIGAECYELMQAQKEKKTSSSDEDELYNKAINTATNILDSFANAMNPMTEMSMLSGLTSALKSYDQDSSKMLASIGTNAVKSYVNQFVPTALGQVAKTTDQYERSTTSTQKGVLPKAIDTTRTQIMNKIPGLRQMLPIKTDIWGNEIEQSDNVIQRAFENAVFPWARKELNSNSVDKELVKVYKNTGDKAVLPDSINKDITINKQKYTMTSGEHSKYKKQYGENSYKLLNSLVTANGYKKMSDEEKRVAISKVYSYATEQIKVDYAKQNELEYEQSTLSQVTNAIKKVDGNTSNYFEFIAKTQELDKDIEKIKTLANSNYDENTKKAIYENSLGKRDNKFNIMKETFTTNGLNTTKYLKYKSQEFESDKTDDGTLNGKTVSGSKKKKVWNYIEQMDITYTQKLLLYGLEYTPSNREQTQIVNYINSLPKTQQEKLEMLSKFQGFTIYKDGTFKY